MLTIQTYTSSDLLPSNKFRLVITMDGAHMAVNHDILDTNIDASDMSLFVNVMTMTS